MAKSRIPGPLCFRTSKPIDEGTLCRSRSHLPGPLCYNETFNERPKLCFHNLNLLLTEVNNNAFSSETKIAINKSRPVNLDKSAEIIEKSKQALEASTLIARRITAIKAFHHKYYNFILDKARKNISGNYRGIVVSAAWKRYFISLGKCAEFPKLAGIPLKANEFSWQDHSARGLIANSLATISQWAYENVLLSAPTMVQVGSDAIGNGLGMVGLSGVEEDFKLFSINLAGAINDVKNTIP